MTNYKDTDHFHQFHEISATSNEIRIWGYRNRQSTYTPIKHDCHRWTTLFLEYKVSTSALNGTYIIDGAQGDFTFDITNVCGSVTFIGGRSDGTKFLNGAIHAIECYSVESKQELPYTLRDLIIESQKIDNDEPCVKRTKVNM